ncbi:hypothetical protein QQX13_07330 [Demequina sp. SYSU T00068]|uniref:hypothetical protein n=1 Tax=Demequina lignilytica TaxID=3051663 RepID=UPI0026338A1E|nr:hypothetical protein [Demequina sp. SYSU T00068]MDN4490641.1 hypothetical protein [Demequina sp. SYSU T00068]
MTENTVARPKAHSSISRRRVVQGAAWATPAILIATASPPAAASVATVTITNAIIDQNGQGSDNFELKLDATVVGAFSGDAILTVVFDVPQGAVVDAVAENSSKWTISEQGTTNGTFTAVAYKAYDNSGTVSVTKFKINVNDHELVLPPGTVDVLVTVSVDGKSSSFPTSFYYFK